MRIRAAAAGTLIFSLAIACVADVHADDKLNGDAPIQKDDQRDHKGAHVPVYRIKSLCPLGYGCVPVGMNARGEASGHVWRWFEDGSESPVLAFVWHPTTDTIEKIENTLGGSTSVGGPLNKQGQMAGIADLSDGISHGFFWDPATDQMEDIGALVQGLRSIPTAINDAGEIVGVAEVAPFDEAFGAWNSHAFFWNPRANVLQDLGSGTRSSFADDINNKGVVTGGLGGEPGEIGRDARFVAFVWESHRQQMQLLPIRRLNAKNAGGHKINEHGQVMGWIASDDSRYQTVFRWDPHRRSTKYLDIDGGEFPIGQDMNESGQIVGWYHRIGGNLRAFVWNPDAETIRDLGAFGSSSVANAISNSGWVTGSSEIAGPDHSHAFLWNDGALLDLNALVAPDDPLRRYVTLISGIAINDAGRILATGTDSREVGFGYHAYVLSPR